MPIETRFKCVLDENEYLSVSNNEKEVIIDVKISCASECIYLDIPTAIKLSKTIRTHINLVKHKQNEQ